MNEYKAPFFIVGVPRSGTTLMASFLSAHPHLIVPPETHFFNYWTPASENTEIDINSFLENLLNSKRFSFFDLKKEEVMSEIQKRENLDLQTIFDAWLSVYAQKQGKERWGEKTPMHYEHLNLIFEWYPHSKVIWMLRDPRSVVASLLKVYWASNLVSVNAKHWKASAKLLKRHWQQDERVKVVTYEDLVREPVKTLVSVCDFLDEDYCADMLTQRSSQEVPLTNRDRWMTKHLQKSLGDLDISSIEKWKREIPCWRVSIVESICRPEMKHYHYRPTQNSLGLRAKALLKAETIIQNSFIFKIARIFSRRWSNMRVHGGD
jgi:hypothetical protein